MNSPFPKGPFQIEEPVILLDRKEREYLARLDPRRAISIRGGKISVDDIIGRDEGSVVRSSLNEPFLVFRPSRARVVEAGVGAGALSIALLRAIGSGGQLISYEIREDFGELARKNVARYFGPAPNWVVKTGDIALEIEETGIDRVILDLPEPWQVDGNSNAVLAL